MNKLTYYDDLSECYKIKPEAIGNTIQRLGLYEHKLENAITELEGKASINDLIDIKVVKEVLGGVING